MPPVVDRDVFPVEVRDRQPEPADDPAVAPDREEQGGVPRVVVDPEDPRVAPALDDPGRLRDGTGVEPAQRLERGRVGILASAAPWAIRLANRIQIVIRYWSLVIGPGPGAVPDDQGRLVHDRMLTNPGNPRPLAGRRAGAALRFDWPSGKLGTPDACRVAQMRHRPIRPGRASRTSLRSGSTDRTSADSMDGQFELSPSRIESP